MPIRHILFLCSPIPFAQTMHKELQLEPQDFGRQLRSTIHSRLIDEVEGKPLGADGYVIHVTQVHDDVGEGVIEDDGKVTFNISYQAILFRPFKNEVLDAKVTVVNEHGFFAKVGPMNVFVSRHAMPLDLQDGYDANGNMWVTNDAEGEIRRDCAVRLKVMNTEVLTNEINAIGSIQQDFMGLIDTD